MMHFGDKFSSCKKKRILPVTSSQSVCNQGNNCELTCPIIDYSRSNILTVAVYACLCRQISL